MNLFKLKGAYKSVYEMEEIDEETWFDTLESITDSIQEKADGYAAVIATIDAENSAIKAEKDRLAKRESVNKNKIERLKKNLLDVMNETGEVKFSTDLHSFGIRKTQSVAIADDWETKLPKEYVRTTFAPDKTTIKEDLKNGVEIPSASLQENEGLSIR